MRVILLTILACMLMSCISAQREREAHCLAVTMMDAWQNEHDVNFAEQAWRAARKARFEQKSAHHEFPTLPVWFANRDVAAAFSQQVVSRGENGSDSSLEDEKERALYQRVVEARARHWEAAKWYQLVARRVQTRIEEDEMLYPVLGMLVTSTAIVLYPVVRWNVRSVLWDGTDPDAENDPVQKFCAARLSSSPPG